MLTKGVTLRGLEVFNSLASTGSVAQTAQVTGLSQPAVSQQIRNLENALGTELVDHSRRPMRLTAAGRGYLVRTSRVLGELRQAKAELTVMDLTHLDQLSIGLIDDFDNDLAPRLVTILATSMSKCRFKMITAPSLEISQAMAVQDLHIAVAASTGEMQDGVVEYPLVRDPFILVAPKGVVQNPDDIMGALSGAALLRYSSEQLISRQIEAHLADLGLEFEERFEIGSHLALMAMVARNIGWAVTTPLGYMRAARFHDEIDAFALPFAPFARTISLFAGADWAESVPRDMAQTIRGLVQSQIIDPGLTRLPWLSGQLKVISP